LKAPRVCKKDTQDAPGSTRSDDLQAELHDTLDTHQDGGDKGEERSDLSDRCEASLKEATSSALKSASLLELNDTMLSYLFTMKVTKAMKAMRTRGSTKTRKVGKVEKSRESK
jgi:hypothetical protein